VTDEERIRQLVRRVVYRTVGRDQPGPSRTGGTLVTAEDIHAVPVDGRYSVPDGALVTPLARQAAMERRVHLTAPSDESIETETSQPANRNAVAVGADHGGYLLKDRLKSTVADLGYEVIDCGTDGPDPVDYPDIALAVARHVAGGTAWRGIVVDGAGIGSCMAANKVPGVRAALCYDEATAVNSREHNHANVLTLGAGMIGDNLARRIVTTWLQTGEGGDRHRRRVDKITEIERRFARADGRGGR
jgi:ribose 5-phosphate isomerase B